MNIDKLELSLACWRHRTTKKILHLQGGRSRSACHVKAGSISKPEKSRATSMAGRCLIPAEGWLEWGGKVGRKTIWQITPKNGGMIYFAGFWRGLGGSESYANAEFSIVTEPVGASLYSCMERAPVVLWGHDRAVWLDPRSSFSELNDLLGPESPDIFDVTLLADPSLRAETERKAALAKNHIPVVKNDRLARQVRRLLSNAEALEAAGRILEAACYRRDVGKLVARYPSLSLL